MLQNNSHPVILELLSLSTVDSFPEDISCSISLVKGIQHFGQINFVYEKNTKKVQFEEGNILKFYYIPRIMNKKDIFFKIVLSDVENEEQIGEISLSTNMLSETFAKNKDTVIEEAAEFEEGVLLSYKIYMPKFQLRREPKAQIKSVQTNDILSALFSLSAPKEEPRQRKKVEVQENKDKTVQGVFGFLTGMVKSTQTEQKKEPQKQQKVSQNFIMNSSDSNIKVHFEESIDKKSSKNDSMLEMDSPEIHIKKIQSQISIGNPPSENKGMEVFANLFKPKRVIENSNDDKSIKSSLTSEYHEDQFMKKTLSFLRDSQYQERKKKNTLMPAHESVQDDHHHRMSYKMKMVIFLLLFGVMMMTADFISDRKTVRKHRKGKKHTVH